jgi:hypothetical protein
MGRAFGEPVDKGLFTFGGAMGAKVEVAIGDQERWQAFDEHEEPPFWDWQLPRLRRGT